MESLISFGKKEKITINGKKALLSLAAFVEYILTYDEYVNHNSVMRLFFKDITALEQFLLDELDGKEFDILKSESGALFRYKWLSTKFPNCTFPLKKKTKAYQQSKNLDYMFLKSVDDDRIVLMRGLLRLKESAVTPINSYLCSCIANCHSRLPCIQLVSPYLNEKRIHNRDIALIRMAIIVSVLRDQVADPMFAEFGLKMECGSFLSHLLKLRDLISKQKIDRFDHALAEKTIYEAVKSDPLFSIFDESSSCRDVEDISFYLNSLVVLEKDVRREVGIAPIVEEMKKMLQFSVSSRLSSELVEEYKTYQVEWVISQMKVIVTARGEMEKEKMKSVCDQCNSIFLHLSMDPFTTSTRYQHAVSLYNSVMKHYVVSGSCVSSNTLLKYDIIWHRGKGIFTQVVK